MKKLSIVLCLCFIFLVSCSNKNQVNAISNQQIAGEICEVENFESYNEETIKTLALYIKSKNSKNKPTKNYNYIDDKILSIVESVSNTNVSFPKNFSFEYVKQNNQSWSIQIEKSKLLEYLSKNDISVSSLTNITTIADENNYISFLVVENVEIPYQTLKEEFGFKSNKITDIFVDNTVINISGEGVFNNEILDLEKVENLANLGKSHTEILIEIFNGYDIKIN